MRERREQAIPPPLGDVETPPGLTGRPVVRSEASLREWEDQLIAFLGSFAEGLTPYPDYFMLRGNEFRVLRGLLKDLFVLDRPHGLLLEIGCGFGYKSTLLAPFARQVVGVDIPEPYSSHTVGRYPNSVAVARALVNGVLGREEIRFETAWPHELPLEDESVDLIYSEYVLEHVEDIPRTVQELKRVLAPGGRMVHVVPNALDALMEFVRINVRVPYRSLAAGFLRRLLRAPQPGPRLVATGAVVPPPHSEFLTDFADQLDIYGLERYVFPMVEQGLRIERITTTRGINTVLVVESVEPGGS